MDKLTDSFLRPDGSRDPLKTFELEIADTWALNPQFCVILDLLAFKRVVTKLTITMHQEGETTKLVRDFGEQFKDFLVKSPLNDIF